MSRKTRRLFRFMQDDPLIPQAVRRAVKKMIPVEVHEPRQGPWTGNNNLGFVTPWDSDGSFEQTVIQLPEWGMPSPWTLALGLAYSDAEAALVRGFDLQAQIGFGCGGASHEIICDWKQGTVLSLPMNSLSVIGKYSGTLAVPNAPADLRLLATLARGTTVGLRPTLTRIHNGISTGGGLGTYARVPNFASRVTVYPVGVAGTTWANVFNAASSLNFWSAPIGVGPFATGSIRADALANYVTEGVPLSGASRYYDFVNQSGSTVNIVVVFHLDC